ncbi:MAG: hypothetical protein Q4A46_05945 [Clostridia bacterium]|nr:hypothetical protein [Clostridia bacterium]
MIDCTETKNYFAEKRRMTKERSGAYYICKLDCADCPLSTKNNGTSATCTDLEILYPEKAIAIVQKWSDEHSQKTYLSEFLKIFPNSSLDNDGTPFFCPYRLGFMSIDDCRNDGNCIKCWNQPILIEDGEE